MFQSGRGLTRPRCSVTCINLVIALFMASWLNGPFWHALDASLGNDIGGNLPFVAAIALSLVLVFNILLSLLSPRPIHKPLLVILLLLSATGGYYMSSYGIVLDRQMMTNLLQTDVREASEQVTWPLLRHLLLWGVFPSALLLLTDVRRHSWRRELTVRGGVVLASGALLLLVGVLNYKQFTLFGRAHREVRMYVNPTYPVYSLFKTVTKEAQSGEKGPVKSVAADARRQRAKKKNVIVLVVGETARASEFSLNGYSRDTNPQLSKMDIVNFSDVHACGTDTAESVPCMFFHLGKEHYSRREAGGYENLLDILKRTGVRVVWRDNNSGSKGVGDRVEYQDLSREQDVTLCSGGECYDDILLKDLDRLVRESPGDTLIVLHQKGSHGPSYYKRSPKEFKAFEPECTQDDVQNCSRQSIINAYDNSIRYTDSMLAKLVDLLKGEPVSTAMLYVSDHGESLGENNIYLHGLPYSLAPDEQTHVPMVFWASDSFMREHGISAAMLRQHSTAHLSHDNLFHSLLGLFGVSTTEYRPELDIFGSRGKGRV